MSDQTKYIFAVGIVLLLISMFVLLQPIPKIPEIPNLINKIQVEERYYLDDTLDNYGGYFVDRFYRRSDPIDIVISDRDISLPRRRRRSTTIINNTQNNLPSSDNVTTNNNVSTAPDPVPAPDPVADPTPAPVPIPDAVSVQNKPEEVYKNKQQQESRRAASIRAASRKASLRRSQKENNQVTSRRPISQRIPPKPKKLFTKNKRSPTVITSRRPNNKSPEITSSRY